MPKFLVTQGSYFQPFTYDELVKPLQQMADAQNTTQDAYDVLSMETEALRQRVMQEPDDSYARQLYDTYANRLETLQNNLWNNGYTPQTRRELSLARSGYANGIKPLQDAIERRNKMSAAYWDARHKNPNLVTGADPGLDPLDDYLRDDNHGSNWFSYDSAQFEQDVFSDMKARAQSILNGLTDENGVVTNPALAGTLTRVISKGVTPDEVSAASTLVDEVIDMTPVQRQAYYQQNGVSPVVNMMTETLISRYDATGIRGFDVDENERRRLLNRGKSGLAGGIMAPEIKDFDDPEYEYRMWKRKIDYQHSLSGGSGSSGSGSGSGKKDEKPPKTYSLNELAAYFETPESRDANGIVHEKFEKPFESAIDIVDINGNPDQITSVYDAQRIQSMNGKDAIRRAYGVDADHPTGKFKVKLAEMGQAEPREVEARVRYRQYDDGLAKSWEYPDTIIDTKFPGNDFIYEYKDEKGKWQIDKEQTRRFNEDMALYNQNKRKFQERNPDVDLEKLSVKEKDWNKIASEYNFSPDVPREAYPAVLRTLAGNGEVSPAYLADSSPQQQSVRESYTNSMKEAYSRAGKNKKGDVDKNSNAAVYKVEKDGKRSPELNLGTVLGRDSNGFIENDNVDAIFFTPEGIIDNEFSFIAGGNQYIGNPIILGNDVNTIVRSMRAPLSSQVGSDMQALDERGQIHYMMKPILDPASIFSMSSSDVIKWVNFTDNTLRRYIRLVQEDENGDIVNVVTPEQIVYSQSYQSALRNAVTRYINDYLSVARDRRNQEAYQPLSGTSSAPGSYYTPSN